jgi:carbonic anhydrase
MSVTDELVANAEKYARSFEKGDLPMPPATRSSCRERRCQPVVVLPRAAMAAGASWPSTSTEP